MTGSLVIEGGGDFPDEPDAEPNFNRDGPPPVSAGGRDRPPRRDRGGDRGRGGRPAAVVVDVGAVAVDVGGGGGGGGAVDAGGGGGGGGRH